GKGTSSSRAAAHRASSLAHASRPVRERAKVMKFSKRTVTVTVRNPRKPWPSRRLHTVWASARARSSTNAASRVSTSNVSCSPTDLRSRSFDTALSERPEIGDGPDVTLVQETLRNDPDPQRIEKRLNLLRSHDREPVGLLKIGGDLGDELVGAYAHRGGQPFLAHDLRLEPAGALDRSVEAAERRELEIRLVDAGL